MSADGRTIIGYGRNPSDEFQCWIATLSAVPIVPGDFDSNGIVNSADYTVWRNNLGTDFDLNGNGNEDGDSEGVVDFADYDTWRSNYGAQNVAGTGAVVETPEPSGLILAVVGVIFACTIVANARRFARATG